MTKGWAEEKCSVGNVWYLVGIVWLRRLDYNPQLISMFKWQAFCYPIKARRYSSGKCNSQYAMALSFRTGTKLIYGSCFNLLFKVCVITACWK